jgi:hypothetical protein
MALVEASIRSHNDEVVALEAHIAKRCEGAKRRAASKKKARQTTDAPSNKTYGNCLLGFHCSHKDSPENRANARFLSVAGGQHELLSTAYTQHSVGFLGTLSWPLISMQISRLPRAGQFRFEPEFGSIHVLLRLIQADEAKPKSSMNPR